MHQTGESKVRSFPGTGKSYRIGSGDGNPFALTYRSDREMAIAWLEGVIHINTVYPNWTFFQGSSCLEKMN